MCILLNVKKHEKTFALNVDIFKFFIDRKKVLTYPDNNGNIKVHCERQALLLGREKDT